MGGNEKKRKTVGAVVAEIPNSRNTNDTKQPDKDSNNDDDDNDDMDLGPPCRCGWGQECRILQQILTHYTTTPDRDVRGGPTLLLDLFQGVKGAPQDALRDVVFRDLGVQDTSSAIATTTTPHNHKTTMAGFPVARHHYSKQSLQYIDTFLGNNTKKTKDNNNNNTVLDESALLATLKVVQESVYDKTQFSPDKYLAFKTSERAWYYHPPNVTKERLREELKGYILVHEDTNNDTTIIGISNTHKKRPPPPPPPPPKKTRDLGRIKITPGPNDVLVVPNDPQFANRHAGNRKLEQLAHDKAEDYPNLSPAQRAELFDDIVTMIRLKGGRFLRHPTRRVDGPKDEWMEVRSTMDRRAQVERAMKRAMGNDDKDDDDDDNNSKNETPSKRKENAPDTTRNSCSQKKQKTSNSSPEDHNDKDKDKDDLDAETSFPMRLHRMLQEAEEEGKEHIVSFLPHGRSFVFHDQEAFVKEIMPNHFGSCSKMRSFKRQLNYYGFRMITEGDERGAYFHPVFLRGRLDLCKVMKRPSVKGKKGTKVAADMKYGDIDIGDPVPRKSTRSSSGGGGASIGGSIGGGDSVVSGSESRASQQRRRRKTRHSMDEDQKEAVENIVNDALAPELPPVKHRPAQQAQWMKMFNLMKEYKEKHDGSCDVAYNDKEYSNLRSWITRQRAQHYFRNLAADRVQMLDDIGFQWQAQPEETSSGDSDNDDKDQDTVNNENKSDEEESSKASDGEAEEEEEEEEDAAAAESDKENEDSDDNEAVKDNISVKKNNKKDGGPSLDEFPEKVFREDQVKLWMVCYKRLKRILDGQEEMPDRSVDKTYCDWVSKQRRFYKLRELSRERKILLDKVGFEWENDEKPSAQPKRSESRNSKRSVNSVGARRDESEDSDNNSNNESENAGSAGRNSAAFGASYTPAQQRQWNQRYRELIAFKRKYGTMDVRFSYGAKYKHLARWIWRQRTLQRQGKLTLDRKELLDKLRFNWKTEDDGADGQDMGDFMDTDTYNDDDGDGGNDYDDMSVESVTHDMSMADHQAPPDGQVSLPPEKQEEVKSFLLTVDLQIRKNRKHMKNLKTVAFHITGVLDRADHEELQVVRPEQLL